MVVWDINKPIGKYFRAVQSHIRLGILLCGVCIFYFGMSANALSQDVYSEFSQDVSTHVLYHELAHGLIREFDLPVLGNEEVMADSFANYYVTQFRRDEASDVILDRVRSWIYEDSEVDPSEYDFKGEHPLDIRRAYQAACWLYGSDPGEWAEDVGFLEFSEHDLADCSDTAPDQIDGWAKTLEPFVLEESKISSNVELIYEDSSMNEQMKSSGLLESFANDVRRFDWPNPIAIVFGKCDSGASWNRERKNLLLCDEYVARFVNQGESLNAR